jgi:uncharacterized protein YndB with AHSA1/START domain
MNAVSQVPPVTVRRKVAAPTAELFDAWLDPTRLAKWMRPGETTRATVELDPRVGGKLEVVMHMPKGALKHTGVYEVIDRPRRLAFTWKSPAATDEGARVTVEFKPIDGGTQVDLTHEGVPGAERVGAHTKGWTRILELMASSYERMRAAG